MEFEVALQPDEYRRAMIWYQFARTPARRLNTLVAWAVLLLTPLLILMLAWRAPEALSIWFWLLAVVAVAYALYSTVGLHYQIAKQADTLLGMKPALVRTAYRVHTKGIHLRAEAGSSDVESLFLPWKKVSHIEEMSSLFLLFMNESDILIIPKRSLPSVDRFRHLSQGAIDSVSSS